MPPTDVQEPTWIAVDRVGLERALRTQDKDAKVFEIHFPTPGEGERVVKAKSVRVLGPSELVFAGPGPGRGGQYHAWIETRSAVDYEE